METTDGSRMSINFQQAETKRTLKGLKVQLLRNKNQSPIGVAASSLSDLINKACVKFKVSAAFKKMCYITIKETVSIFIMLKSIVSCIFSLRIKACHNIHLYNTLPHTPLNYLSDR